MTGRKLVETDFGHDCMSLYREHGRDRYRERRLAKIAWRCVERRWTPIGGKIVDEHAPIVLVETNLKYLLRALFEGTDHDLWVKMRGV